MRLAQLLGNVNRDGQILIVARGLRTLAHGAASVVLAIYLDLRGFSLAEIGVFLTAGGLGAAAWALVIGIVAGGLLKIAYDLILWRLFVGVKPPEEITK